MGRPASLVPSASGLNFFKFFNFVSFCFFLRLGCAPGPASSGLGGCLSPAWALPIRAYFRFVVLCFWWSPFGCPSLFLPRQSGLHPVGVFSFFSFFAFYVSLSWFCAHSAAPSVWMFHSWLVLMTAKRSVHLLLSILRSTRFTLSSLSVLSPK